jgi:hypothetical protein
MLVSKSQRKDELRMRREQMDREHAERVGHVIFLVHKSITTVVEISTVLNNNCF